MSEIVRRQDRWLVALGAASLIAWSALVAGTSNTVLPDFCAALAPLSASLDLALALNSPAQLAAAWALMIAAMMTPMTVAPLRHVRDRSFASRRSRASLLFVAGYFAVWMLAGCGLQGLALVARSMMPDPALCFAAAVGAALVWQISPAKQWFLNRCHREPELAAFGATADRAALAYGARNGAACVGACWALMLLPLVAAQFHLVAMSAVALFVFAERLEGPAPLAWRWRGIGKAMRIVVAQVRIRASSSRAAVTSRPTP